MCAVTYGYYVEVCCIADLVLIYISYVLDEGINLVIFYDTYGTAAKACSCHSRTDYTRLLPCSLS